PIVGALGLYPALRQDVPDRPGGSLELLAHRSRGRIDHVVEKQMALVQSIAVAGEPDRPAAILLQDVRFDRGGGCAAPEWLLGYGHGSPLFPAENKADVSGHASRVIEHFGLQVKPERPQMLMPEIVCCFGPAFQSRLPAGLGIVDFSAAIAAQSIREA